MDLSDHISVLQDYIDRLPRIGMVTLGGTGAPMFLLDFVMIGSVKRTLSLACGFRDLVNARNLVCSRALIRMQLDTVSRLLAYTYVDNPEEVTREILAGERLDKFKSREGKPLRDRYLVDRLSEKHEWVRNVYDYTSGYVHFSERQIFDSVHSVGDDTERTVNFQIGESDENLPEERWIEMVACFNHALAILENLFSDYGQSKREIGPSENDA